MQRRSERFAEDASSRAIRWTTQGEQGDVVVEHGVAAIMVNAVE